MSKNSHCAPSSHRAIVAGFGPVGRTVAGKLRDIGFEVVILELNLSTIEKQLDLDRRIIYGSASDPDTLTRAGIDTADALILTMPNENDAIEACRVARQLNPNIFIAARTNFVSRGMLASQVGADAVVVEEIVTAEAMQKSVVEHLIAKGKREKE